MNILRIFLALFFFSCFWASISSADIYSWKDESGVMHFTNYSPPPGAKIVVKDVEIPLSTEPEEQGGETVELREEQPEQIDQGLEKVKNLVEDLANRLSEANRMAEDAMASTEALEEEPYYSETYYSRGSGRYLYVGGVKSRYGPGFYQKHHSAFRQKRPYHKPKIWDRHPRSHRKSHAGFQHNRVFGWQPPKGKGRPSAHYFAFGKGHYRGTSVRAKGHFSGHAFAFGGKGRLGGRGSAFGGKGRFGGGRSGR